MLIGSIAGILIYSWLLFFIAPQLMLQISAFIAVAAIFVILGWIGYTMASIPSTVPLEGELTSSQNEASTQSISATKESAA